MIDLPIAKLKYLQPLVQDILHGDEFLFPGGHVCLKRLHVRRPSHGLCFEDMVIQLLLDFV